MLSLFQALNWIDEGLQNTLIYKGWGSVSRTQSLIMILIHAGETRPTEVAKALGLSRQAIHRTISDMIENKLVRLEPDANDGRAKVLAFHEEAAELRDDARKALVFLEKRLEKRIGEETVSELKRALYADWGKPFDPKTEKNSL